MSIEHSDKKPLDSQAIFSTFGGKRGYQMRPFVRVDIRG